MENTNTNLGGQSGPDEGSGIPISPEIPKPDLDLSTAKEGVPVMSVNHDAVPPQESKKEDFFFDGSKMDLSNQEVAASREGSSPAPSPKIEMPKKDEKPKILSQKPVSPGVRKKIIAILVAVLLLVILGGGAYYFITANREIPVNITLSQAGVTLFVDGKQYDNIASPHKVMLKKGAHTITARKDGFADLQKTLTISATQNSLDLSFTLTGYQTIEKIYAQEVFFPAFSKDLNSLFYLTKGDKAYSLKQLSLDNQKEDSLLENITAGISKVSWSPTFRQVDLKVLNSDQSTDLSLPYLEKYGSGTKVNWVVNLERKDLVSITAKDLHPSIKNITFNPDGNKIAYLFQNDTAKELAIANIDGTNFETLVQFKTIDFEPDVAWSPDGRKLAIFANMENGMQSNAKEVNIYIYDFETRNVSKITEDGTSTGAVFSPDSKKLIYQSGRNLWLYDLESKDNATAALDLKLQGDLLTCSWVDGENFVALSSEDGSLQKVKTSGIKESINYQKVSLPSGIKSVIYGNQKVYLINNDGIYQLLLNSGV